jgi:hypothetical protein
MCPVMQGNSLLLLELSSFHFCHLALCEHMLRNECFCLSFAVSPLHWGFSSWILVPSVLPNLCSDLHFDNYSLRFSHFDCALQLLPEVDLYNRPWGFTPIIFVLVAQTTLVRIHV